MGTDDQKHSPGPKPARQRARLNATLDKQRNGSRILSRPCEDAARMGILAVECTALFDPEMDRLRRRVYYTARPVDSWSDPFDEAAFSVHLRATLGPQLAATLRLTPQPLDRPGVVECGTRGAARIPRGTRVVELSRAVVDPRWRRQRIFSLLVCTALEQCVAAEFSDVVTLVPCGLPVFPLLERLGFEELPARSDLFSYDLPGQAVRVIGMRHRLRSLSRIKSEKAAILSRITARYGWSVTGLAMGG
jgi:hypothetical protein